MQQEAWSQYQFGLTRLHAENASFWTFFAGSPDLIEAGHVPGGLFAFVDKRTGRLWTMEEVEQFYTPETAARYTQSEAVAA